MTKQQQTKVQYMNCLEAQLDEDGEVWTEERVRQISVWRTSKCWNPFQGEDIYEEVLDLYHIYLEPCKKGGWVGWSPEDGGVEFYSCLQQAWDDLHAFEAYLLYP